MSGEDGLVSILLGAWLLVRRDEICAYRLVLFKRRWRLFKLYYNLKLTCRFLAMKMLLSWRVIFDGSCPELKGVGTALPRMG